MQSVFKLPLAMAVLHQVEHRNLSLDQLIRFRASDRILPHTYSPLQEKYPNAEVDIALESLLHSAVSLSDNVAADILLRIAGGTKVVDDYILGLGVRGFHLQDNEAALHRDVMAQYRNWFEPRAAVALLQLLDRNSPLTPGHTRLLLGWIEETPRGTSRIKAGLPSGTVVMHKAGTSGTDNGVTHAINDIGLVTLPDGRRFAIAVFITDSTAAEETCEAVIARIARAAYDAAVQNLE